MNNKFSSSANSSIPNKNSNLSLQYTAGTATNGGLSTASTTAATTYTVNTTPAVGQLSIGTASNFIIDDGTIKCSNTFSFDEKDMLEYARVGSGMYKNFKEMIRSNYFLSDYMEDFNIIRSKYFQQPSQHFKEEDQLNIMGYAVPFMRRLETKDLDTEGIPKQVAIILQYFSENDFREILLKESSFENKFAISMRKISEEFFEEILSSTTSRREKYLLINAFVTNNRISNEFLKKYYKQIDLTSLAAKKRKSFTRETEKIIEKEFQKSINLERNLQEEFPDETIKNLKVPSDILNRLLEENLQNISIRSTLWNQIINSILYNGERFPLSRKIIEEGTLFSKFIPRWNRRIKDDVSSKIPVTMKFNNSFSSYAYGISSDLATYKVAVDLVKTYDEIVKSLYSTGIVNNLEYSPYFYIASPDNISHIVRKIKEKSLGNEFDGFFNLIEDFQEKVEDLPEEFFIEFFDDFVKENVLFSLSISTSTGVGTKTGKKTCYLKEFVDIHDPDFSSLKLLYELQRSEMNFVDSSDN